LKVIHIQIVRGNVKKNYISNLVRKEEVFFFCLQETKYEQVNEERGYQLWGSNDVDWIENGAVNNGGGLITMWRKNAFELTSFRNGRGFTIIEGVWKIGGQFGLQW